MPSRSGGARLGTDEDTGLLTISDVPLIRERPAPGARLRKSLAELDERQGEEARRRAEARTSLAADIKTRSDQRAKLLDEAKRVEAEIVGLRSKLDQLPDEASERTQRVADRLAAFGRVLRAEVHMVKEMLDAFATYQRERRRWKDEVGASPELEESRKLVAFHAMSPGAIAELPEVLRGIIERQLNTARDSLSEMGEPTRPHEVAPIYECVTPSPEGGSVVAVVIPAACDALSNGHPQAGFVAQILASMSQALLEETDADAPIVICPSGEDPLNGTVVVGATCTTDALDADLFGVRVQELLGESDVVGVEVQPVDDVELAAGLAELIRKRVAAR